MELSNDKKWVEKMDKIEDYGPVSAGGLHAQDPEPQKKKVIPVTVVIEGGCFQELLCDDPSIEFEVTVEDHDVQEEEGDAEDE